MKVTQGRRPTLDVTAYVAVERQKPRLHEVLSHFLSLGWTRLFKLSRNELVMVEGSNRSLPKYLRGHMLMCAEVE